jgi:transcriptional regulator with XRE-family HTH domain
MEIDYARLGKMIRALREAQRPKVSREALAESIGVNQVSVYRWENQEGKPELDHVLKIAQFFEMSLGELLEIQEKPPQKSDLIARLVAIMPGLDEIQLGQLVRLAETHARGVTINTDEAKTPHLRKQSK